MSDNVLIDRLQFTLTVTFHYLFPIITMGLALFVAWMKTVSYLGREDHRFPLLRKTEAERAAYESASRFWAKIFAVNFAFGVVTGIPLEFQFGTNWAKFSNYAGGVIGQTLAMEGVFAFFAESVFLGIFLAGRERVSPAAALALVALHRVGGLVAVGLLHHRDERLDAAPGRLLAWATTGSSSSTRSGGF